MKKKLGFFFSHFFFYSICALCLFLLTIGLFHWAICVLIRLPFVSFCHGFRLFCFTSSLACQFLFFFFFFFECLAKWFVFVFRSTFSNMVIPFSNTKLRVPKGFQSLLVGLSTEVLRSQPRNIHEFAADYFEKLLVRRGKSIVVKFFFPQKKKIYSRIYNCIFLI